MTKKFRWRDRRFERLEQSGLSWGQMEKLEEVTGVTTAELEDPKVAGRARVMAALCWLSVNDQDSEVTFAEFFNSKLGEFEMEEGEEETVPLPPVADPLDSAGTDGSGSGSSGTST